MVTYQSHDAIGPCIDALAECVNSIVVVDNASGDGTASLVRERYPTVEVIANADNVGFARAVNQGIARTHHDTLMLVNPDCVLAAGTAHALSEHLHRHPDVGIAAPRLLDSAGDVVVSAHRFETLVSVFASRFGGSLVLSRVRGRVSWGTRRATYAAVGAGDQEAVTVDWASGACLAIRGALLDRLGGLDEGYFMYYEDEDFCLQARREGASVAYLPGVTAQHVGGASSSDAAALWPWLYASMLRFFALHRPASVPALRTVLVLRACIGVALATLRGRRRSALAWSRIARIAVGSAPAGAGARR
ncbi:MAG: glycosyltransferase family 2 protein [Actinobacteria bacterium]|nr:glycosyltransferase family 2 protein [Actinomycetota bacterium]